MENDKGYYACQAQIGPTRNKRTGAKLVGACELAQRGGLARAMPIGRALITPMVRARRLGGAGGVGSSVDERLPELRQNGLCYIGSSPLHQTLWKRHRKEGSKGRWSLPASVGCSRWSATAWRRPTAGEPCMKDET
jgi:hypothetical protein